MKYLWFYIEALYKSTFYFTYWLHYL